MRSSLASLATQLNDLCKRFIESIEQLTSVEAEVEIDLIAFLLPLTICDFILCIPFSQFHWKAASLHQCSKGSIKYHTSFVWILFSFTLMTFFRFL